MIVGIENRENYAVINADVPLASMFGYATVVRGMTKGMGTFTMEMARYAQVPVKISEEILLQRKDKAAKVKK
jgi:elongation factor G